MSGAVGWLLLIFSQLSLLAVGGGISVLQEMQRQVVDVHGWMSAGDFAALFALAQAAPGPNILVVTAVGWRVAGLAGALTATLGMIGPSSVLTWFISRAWHRFREAAWRRTVQAGLVPLTVGLILGSAALLTAATTTNWLTAAITAATVAVVLGTRLHPIVMLAIGAAAGAALA